MHSGFEVVHVEPLEGSFDGNVEVELVEWDDIDDESTHNELAYRYRMPGQEWSDTEEVFVDDDSSDVSLPVTLDLPGGKVSLFAVGTSDISDVNANNVSFSLLGTHVEQIGQSDSFHSYAQGEFSHNVLVEMTNTNPLDLSTQGNTLNYKFSLDGGQTWETGSTTTQGSGGYTSLPVSGGILKIAPNDDAQSLNEGDQFLVQPRTAGMASEISEDVHVDMNNVGTEIFGGHYQNEDGLEPAFEEEETRNMFLGVGRLISALERNDQDAVNESLGYLDGAMEQVAQKQAEIGARENRLEVSEKILTNLELNQKERKSYIEDVDFAELMSQLTQQQTVYQAVLKSSSMIMRMSLVNYL